MSCDLKLIHILIKTKRLLIFLDSKYFEKAYFITGQRGCQLLKYQGYTFCKNRKSKSRTYWICAKKVTDLNLKIFLILTPFLF